MAARRRQDHTIPRTYSKLQSSLLIFTRSILSNHASINGHSFNLSTVVSCSLITPPRSRTERQDANLRLMLLLLRNLLAIRDGAPGINMTIESVLRTNLQERIVESMFRENVLEMLVAFTGSMGTGGYDDWNVIILEIVFYVLGDRDPGCLINGLEFGLDKKEIKAAPATAYSRHPRFGGCLAVVSTSGKRMVAHSSAPNMDKVLETVDASKKKKAIRVKQEYKQMGYKAFVSTKGCDAFRVFALGILENGFNGIYVLFEFYLQR